MTSSRPIVLGVDPSISKAGYSVVTRDRILDSGVIRTSSELPEPVRVWLLFSEVSKLIAHHEVDEVAIERFRHFFRSSGSQDPPFGPRAKRRGQHDRDQVNPRSMFLLQAANTSITLAALTLGRPVFLYLPSEWKGGPRVGKEEVKKRVSMVYKTAVRSDDVADAIMIGNHHIQVRKLPTSEGIRIKPDELSRYADLVTLELPTPSSAEANP